MVVLRVGEHHGLARHIVRLLLFGKYVVLPFPYRADAAVLVRPRAVAPLSVLLTPGFLLLLSGSIRGFRALLFLLLSVSTSLRLPLPQIFRHKLHVAFLRTHLQHGFKLAPVLQRHLLGQCQSCTQDVLFRF